MLTTYTQGRLKRGLGSSSAAEEIQAAIDGGLFGTNHYVDTFHGSDANDGKTWGTAFATMTTALAALATGDFIYFRGDVREECTGSNLVFDVTIVGCGGLHHPDQPASTYDPGSSTWRAPASPTAATPLLKLRGRGWKFINVFFDCPVDEAAIYLDRNALSDTSEYDPSHASFYGCRFVDGKYAIQDHGGCYNIRIEDCEFKGFTTCTIKNTSTAVAAPLNWKIKNCHFHAATNGFGSAAHIAMPCDNSIIVNNTFGTVTSTGKYIDISGGNGGNLVSKNVLSGAYDTSDYVSGTGDVWYENYCAVTAVTAPDGRSILVPAA